MTKKTILGTGLSGLIGSKLVQQYSGEYQFDSLNLSSLQKKVDITNFKQVSTAVEQSKAKFLVHFAAYTNVTAAWKQTNQKDGSAYQVNVKGTQNIVRACLEQNKHLIHISTAYVFDGNKDEPYQENDPIAPIEWYGYTKAIAEEIVKNTDTLTWTILRIDQPFRSDAFKKDDAIRKIVKALNQEKLPPQFHNHYFGPTFIDDFVRVIDWIIRKKKTGIFHASAGESWTDYDFAIAVKKAFNLQGTIKKNDLEKYLHKSNRPYHRNTALNTKKLTSKIDFQPHSIRSALKKVQLY